MAQWGPQMHCGFQGPPNFKVETQWRTCASKIKAQHYFTSNTLWRKEISSPPWKPSHSHNRQKPDKSTQPSDLDSFQIIHFLLCPDILGWSTNSQPFSLFGSDLDQVQNSGPYWSDCRVWKYLFLAILVQFLLLENPRLASIHQCSISAHQSEGKPLEQVPRCHSLITSLDTTPWTFLCTAAAATVERM